MVGTSGALTSTSTITIDDHENAPIAGAANPTFVDIQRARGGFSLLHEVNPAWYDRFGDRVAGLPCQVRSIPIEASPTLAKVGFAAPGGRDLVLVNRNRARNRHRSRCRSFFSQFHAEIALAPGKPSPPKPSSAPVAITRSARGVLIK